MDLALYVVGAMAKKAYQHTRMVCMVAGLSNGKVIAYFLFDGNCNNSFFESYVQAILIKVLTLGQTVILDNISFHKTVMIKSLIESVGRTLLYSNNVGNRYNQINFITCSTAMLISLN
ncbi:IS630 family transposase [Orientia tsutsugamushi str. Gilliam]|uniref:IS630 family transposase n=1 Tax=Orientia tsutsugamushi str. Gilliam TaxID=1359184 RepID=A0A2U3QW76_ORITS|nr:IS630 family transposase [Orientia tsutsugamushi str. Gilliam]